MPTIYADRQSQPRGPLLHPRQASPHFLSCNEFRSPARDTRHFFPLMPLAIEQLDLSEYDAVVSSSHAFAKGVLTRGDQVHISYVHTPIRYAWDMQHEYLRQAGLERGLRSTVVRLMLHYIRNWDRSTADRVDVFVCNSQHIARRIWRAYRRHATVIYPPVDVDRFQCGHDRDDFYLAASRFVPYKRMATIAEAFARLPNRRLIMIGDGPEFRRVAKQAAPTCSFWVINHSKCCMNTCVAAALPVRR